MENFYYKNKIFTHVAQMSIWWVCNLLHQNVKVIPYIYLYILYECIIHSIKCELLRRFYMKKASFFLPFVKTFYKTFLIKVKINMDWNNRLFKKRDQC